VSGRGFLIQWHQLYHQWRQRKTENPRRSFPLFAKAGLVGISKPLELNLLWEGGVKNGLALYLASRYKRGARS
jgi:hypothetical protein